MNTSKDQESGTGEQLKWWEEESANERRQYECLRKYDRIVNQFDELMEMMDAVTQPQNRRKPSSAQARKKPTPGAGASQPALTADEALLNQQTADLGASSKIPSPTKAEKASVLEQTLATHLSDLQSNQPHESSSQNSSP